MKPLRYLTLLALVFLVSACEQERKLVPYDGDPEPRALVLPDLTGKRHDLKEYRGRVLLVNFWASWCPPCRAEMPSLWRLQQTLQDDRFAVLAVNMEENPQTVNAYLPQQMKRDFVVLLDETGISIKSWGLRAYPVSYIIDKRGKIRYALAGEAKWDQGAIVQQMRALLAEK